VQPRQGMQGFARRLRHPQPSEARPGDTDGFASTAVYIGTLSVRQLSDDAPPIASGA
jgi:hypothetical protein